MYSDADKAEGVNLSCRWWALLLASARSERRSVLRTAPRWPEVVWVYEQFRLIDAESYQHRYRSKNHKPLKRGYYIVCWPVGVKNQLYDEDAMFHGPFSSRRQADTVLERIRAIGQGFGRHPPCNAMPNKGPAPNKKKWPTRQDRKPPKR